jgi:diguanylate cyclase (GGDEF)-like protein/PAS domain S-box-containing protein
MHALQLNDHLMSVPEQVIRLRRNDPQETPSHTSGPKLTAQDAMPPLSHLPMEDQARIWTALSTYSDEGVLICDAQQRILYVNNAFERVTGYTAAEVVGLTPRVLQSGQQGPSFYAAMWSDVMNKGFWRGEICNRRKNGDLYIEGMTLACVRNSANKPIYFVAAFSDLTQRKHRENRLEYLATHDALTDLPNRKTFSRLLTEVLENARITQQPVALLLLDLDRFENVNDSMGHDCGDLLLQTISKRLLTLTRRSDVVARVGGDEFAIALVDVPNVAHVERIARKILAEISQPITVAGRDFEITGCIGMCMYPDDAQDSSGMIRHADTAMHRAKNTGRNSCQFYTGAMSREARARLDLETDLVRAIRQNQFVLYYQPQIDLRTGDVLSVESLIRWNRPGRGLVMPSEFIAFAEEHELIAEIGEWTLETAAEQAVTWDRAGFAPFGIAVNVSAPQFHCDHFVERVANILERKKLAPCRLELEITEGVIMRDNDATVDILNQLQRLGVSLSIDDFGTGYSSLSYLRRFPVGEIKIDRSFVSEMTKDEGAAGIVRGIIELAHSLKLQVVAEGVETCEQLKRLMDLKCDRAQGYLISRPLPADNLGRFLNDWSQRWKTMTS